MGQSSLGTKFVKLRLYLSPIWAAVMTPIKFERQVEKLSNEDRPNEFIFKWDHQLSTKSELLTKEKSGKKENL